MARLAAGYDVGSFEVYRDFRDAVDATQQFLAEKGSNYQYGEALLELHRENVGCWHLVPQGSPDDIWGEIQLVPKPGVVSFNMVSRHQFDKTWSILHWLAEELRNFVEEHGLMYPKNNAAFEKSQAPAPVVHGDLVEGNKVVTNSAGGDIVAGNKITTYILSVGVAASSLQGPLLIPQSRLVPGNDFWSEIGQHQLVVQNVGHDIAIKIRGVILPTADQAERIPSQFSMHHQPPVKPDDLIKTVFNAGGTMFGAADRMGTFPLVVPTERAFSRPFSFVDRELRCFARLTLTYWDSRGSKHASISDLTQDGDWTLVAALNDIGSDISDLDLAKSKR